MNLPADVHTHNPDPERDALINLEAVPGLVIPDRGVYSVGVHPWNAGADDIDRRLYTVARFAALNRVLAIGEAGLDKLKGPDLDRQIDVFMRQASIAEHVQKPIIIHCVKVVDELLAVKNRLRPTVPWIYHGFRGGPEQARQLLSHGLKLSFGTRFNPDALAVTPHPLFETD